MEWIRAQNCCITGAPGQYGDVVAHHVRLGGGGGVSLKPSDFRCIPLHYSKHNELHAIGEKTFFSKTGFQPENLIALHLLKFIDEHGNIKDINVLLEDFISKEIHE